MSSITVAASLAKVYYHSEWKKKVKRKGPDRSPLGRSAQCFLEKDQMPPPTKVEEIVKEKSSNQPVIDSIAER